VTAREDTATLREDAASVREDAVGLREDAASVREEAAQDDLRDSRVMLAQTGRLAKVGGWQLNVDTQTLIWTEEVYRIHEVDPAIKPTVAEAIRFYAPEARPVITAAVEAAINAGTSFDLELPLQTARGRHIWVRTLGIARRHDGKTIRVHGACQDITTRKQAEGQLCAMAEMLDTAPSLITVYDRQGRCLFANRKTYEIHGYDEREFIGLNLRNVDVPESAALIEERMRVVAEQGGATFESVHVRKDRTRLPLEVIVKQVEWAGAPAVLSIATDITERKRAEETLAESQRELAAIFDTAADGILLAETEGGKFRSANVSICRMLGYSQDEMLDLGVSDILPKEDMAHGFEEFERHVKGESALSVNLRLKKKDGSVFFADVSSAPVTLGSKSLLVGIFRDITERKRAESERATLEAQVRQAQKMESVGRLAGGVAHDFNNMLSVILGHAELALAQVDLTLPLHADLEEIYKAAMRSADLTRQLLAFARKQTVAPTVLDLNESVGAILTMLRRLIGEDIDLVWRPGENLWRIRVDPSQIDQILANLCVNARDAIAGVGKVTIETETVTFDDAYCANHLGFVPGEYVRLAVSDDGCGMDTNTLSHVFEPFFTTKVMGQGTGLGLSTVYGIVKQNSGFINVYSEPKHGTTFTIYLPRHVGKAVQARAEGATRPARRGHETILLVEDESSILTLTKRLLENQGYTVLAASTPGEAISLAKDHAGEIHLLMTDVVMPEMNGRDLAAKLLSLSPHIKCLFTSGYTANVIAHHGVLDEDVHFIQKPFSLEVLATKVRDALDALN
jgi:PAS domain S-box-containing protein